MSATGRQREDDMAQDAMQNAECKMQKAKWRKGEGKGQELQDIDDVSSTRECCEERR